MKSLNDLINAAKDVEAAADDYFSNKCDVHSDDADLSFKNFKSGSAHQHERLAPALKIAIAYIEIHAKDCDGRDARKLLGDIRALLEGKL